MIANNIWLNRLADTKKNMTQVTELTEMLSNNLKTMYTAENELYRAEIYDKMSKDYKDWLLACHNFVQDFKTFEQTYLVARKDMKNETRISN